MYDGAVLEGPPSTKSLRATLVNNAEHGVAVEGNVVIQVRRGRLTVELLESIASYGRATRLKQRRSMGLISVLEEGAPIASAEVNRRQIEIAMSMTADPGARLAVVVLGSGALSALKHTLVSLPVRSRATQQRVFDEIPPAVAWIAAELRADAAAIQATIDRLRQPASSR